MHTDYMAAVESFPAAYRDESSVSVPYTIGSSATIANRRIMAEARAIKHYGYSASLRLHRHCLAEALQSE